MKIPKWTREPQTAVVHSGSAYRNVAKLLEVEASFHRRLGNKSGANTLLVAAQTLREIADFETAPAVAFGWEQDVAA